MSRRTRMLSASLSTSLAPALLGACSTQGGDDRDPDKRQPGVATGTVIGGTPKRCGTPIRVRDIKYNVERSLAPDLAGGPDYARRYPADAEGYAGPLDGKHLDSIRTPDDRTILFSLRRPVAEFSCTVTLPTFSPAPESREKGVQYDLRPFSSGPYRIESYARGKKLVLVRNIHWDAATDPARKAYPDRIVVIQGLKGGQIDDRIIESAGVDASAVEWSDLQPSSVAKVLPKPRRSPESRSGFGHMASL